MLVAGTFACDRDPAPLPPVDVAVHRDSIEQWHAARHRAIYGPTGWATMLGLWWIQPGETTVGSDTPALLASVEMFSVTACCGFSNTASATFRSSAFPSPPQARAN